MTHKNDLQALKRTVRFFETVMRASADGIVVTDSAKNIIFVNETFCKIFYVNRQDLIETNLSVWLEKLGHNASNIWKDLESRINKNAFTKDAEFAMKTGEGMRYFLVNFSFLEKIDIEETGLIISIWHDITQLKEAENEMKESNEYLNNLFNYANAPIIVWDQDLKIDRFNHAFEYLTGRKEHDVKGKPLEILFPPNLIESSMELIRKTSCGERWESVEIEILHLDGSIRTVLWNSATIFSPENKIPIATIAQGQDITERKLIEDTFKKEKMFIEGALNGLQDIFYVFDLNGRFLRWNKAFNVITGYSDEEIAIKKSIDLFKEKDIPKVSNAIEMVMKNGTAKVEAEIVSKSGEHINYELTGTLLRDYDGKPLSICGSGRNITEIARAALEYKTILHTAMDGFYLVDILGRILDVNDSYCSIIGYSREELLNMGLKDIEVSETEEVIAQRIKRIMEVGWDRFETLHKRKDGRIIEIEASVNYNSDGGGKLYSFMREITDRKRSEYILKENEENFRSVAQSANDAIITTNSNGDITFWNIGAHNIFGYDNEEVIGKPLTILIPEIYRDAHRNGLKRRVNTGVSHVTGTAELSGLRKDGREFSLELSLSTWTKGDAIFFTGIIRDITERKRTHDALMNSEEKYRTLYDGSSDAIMLLDEKGFFDCNNATLRIFGFSNKEDFIKLNPSQVSPPYQPDGADSGISANNKIVEAFKSGANHFEWVHRKNNGEDFPADVLLSAFDFKGKRVLQATVRDITEQKRSQELQIENARLENESKAKSEFLASMSHELRTPLNAIIGFSDIMIAGIGGNLNETHKGYVKDIYKAGEHLLLIINDILDLSKVEAGKMELLIGKFPVNELVEETITLIKTQAIKHNIDIIRDVDSQLEFIDGDKQKLKQVLFNLLSNAVKFSKENGGTITIAVKKIDRMISFSVFDTGIGIEIHNLNKLFKEFQQLDSGIARKYGGTGLGLVISKKFVELHGGKINVESVYGKGSTFTFTIPVLQGVN